MFFPSCADLTDSFRDPVLRIIHDFRLVHCENPQRIQILYVAFAGKLYRALPSLPVGSVYRSSSLTT